MLEMLDRIEKSTFNVNSTSCSYYIVYHQRQHTLNCQKVET